MVSTLYVATIAVSPRVSLIGRQTEHRVFVNFGFHVNLYHSFRGDTDDEQGFGKDIRVIRKILEVLDAANARGVPVRAHWDADNLFSLEEILPAHAPDIVEGIRRRVREHGDEVLPMAYANGLVSAMTEDELGASIAWSLSNDRGSGVRDLFGDFSPYVRPQEMMTTPGSLRVYREQGIEALLLYYSAITFDAFRLFERPLSLAEAHNPLTWRLDATGESMTVIPVYNIGDLAENVSLRRWVRELHRAQLRGEIDRDVLLCINFDADNDYWAGMDLPGHLKRLPNTNGIEGLIAEIEDLDYVRFTTLRDYLADHPPAGEITFSQDTADGGYNGYSSWAEKASTLVPWTEVARSRRAEREARRRLAIMDAEAASELEHRLDELFRLRLRLLSTTHFGLATPFLARGREQVVDGLVARLRAGSEEVEQAVVALAAAGTRRDPSVFEIVTEPGACEQGCFLDAPILELGAGERLALEGPEGERVEAVAMPRPWAGAEPGSTRLFVHSLASGFYQPREASEPASFAAATASATVLANEHVEVRLDNDGGALEVRSDDQPHLLTGSLLPAIRYRGRIHRARASSVRVEADGSSGLASLRLEGPVELPGASAGSFVTMLTLLPGVPQLFVDGYVQYPETPLPDLLKEGFPRLVRRYDQGWEEVAPAPLLLGAGASPDSPFRVLKHNSLGVRSAYEVDYHRHSKVNLRVANVNNHVTDAYVAVAGTDRGVAVAMDTTVQASFAFAPMAQNIARGALTRVGALSLRISPFGVHHGAQLAQPTWGDGLGYELTLLSAEQFASGAPTFNGFAHPFSLQIAFFAGRELPEGVARRLLDFAHPPVVLGDAGWVRPAPPPARLLAAPRGLVASYDPPSYGVWLHWEKPAGDPAGYRIEIRDWQGPEEHETVVTSLWLDRFRGRDLHPGNRYFAVVRAVSAEGIVGPASEELEFTPVRETPLGGNLELPLKLQLRAFWATLESYVD